MYFETIVDRILDPHLGIRKWNLNEESPKRECAKWRREMRTWGSQPRSMLRYEAHKRTHCAHHTRRALYRRPDAPLRSAPRVAHRQSVSHNAGPWGLRGAGLSLCRERWDAYGGKWNVWDPSDT
jgi:hypothetical protein